MPTAAAICPICTSRKMYYAFSVQRSRLVECRDCGHMMLHPPPSHAELNPIQDESYGFLDGSARPYMELVKRCLGRHGGRLLQIGCGAGELLAVAADLGYDVTGVENSERACAKARARLGGRGRVIHGGIVGGPRLRADQEPAPPNTATAPVLIEENYFDVCVIADVIECTQDPRAFLERVYQAVRLGGIVLIATPSLQSWPARLMKDKWTEFQSGRLHYFTQETLHSLLFQMGLDPIAAFSGRQNPANRAPAAFRTKTFQIAASGMISVSVKVPRTPQRRLSVIVPAYNEAATLEPVLRSVLEKKLDGVEKELVIVESNSSDGTRDIVLKYRDCPGVKVVLEDRARGKGHAVRTGLAHATGDYILIQDGDREYDIEDYDVLIEPLVSGAKAFILGSRHGGRTWKVRRFKGKPFTGTLLNFGHWFFKTLVNLVLRLRLDDPFTMYKVFRRDCIAGLSFECNRFDFDYELLIKIVRKGYRPAEIPVNYRSRSFSEGKKVSVARDPWTWVRAIFKYRWAEMDVIQGWRTSLTPNAAEDAAVRHPAWTEAPAKGVAGR